MNELAKHETQLAPLTASDVASHDKLIQEIMQAVMKPGQHYGVIPGCGNKPALFKAGAEKLSVAFHLAPEFRTEIVELGNGHREYRMVTRLISRATGQFIGEGVGSCSTMESKYRYRDSKSVTPTENPVPKAYWNAKKDNPKAAQEMLGGPGFIAQKIDASGQPTKEKEGNWMICKVEKGEKGENPDIADQYNTVWKMAKKRSLVDATITATGASDSFTQDIEERIADLSQFIDVEVTTVPEKETPKAPRTAQKPEPVPEEQKPAPAAEGVQKDAPDEIPMDFPQSWREVRSPITGISLGEIEEERLKKIFETFNPVKGKEGHAELRLALNEAAKEKGWTR